MRFWKRWLTWTVFVSGLVGLGVFIYQIEAPEPRWASTPVPSVAVAIAGSANVPRLLRFSADGKLLYLAAPEKCPWRPAVATC
jgi:hypothetical protein